MIVMTKEDRENIEIALIYLQKVKISSVIYASSVLEHELFYDMMEKRKSCEDTKKR